MKEILEVMNIYYTAHTFLKKPESYYVIGYIWREPDSKSEDYPDNIEGCLDYNADHEKWLSTEKYFRVKTEDADTFIREIGGSLDIRLNIGINIESIAHRVVFEHTCCVDDEPDFGCNTCEKAIWFATLKPEDKPVEESQSSLWNEIIGEIDKPVGLMILSRLKAKFTITRKAK